MAKKKKNYRIGRGKPPMHTRFKPGQSGNPSGRPKKRLTSLSETIERELNTWVNASDGCKRQRFRKQDAIAKQLTIMALKGDFKAIALVMKVLDMRGAERVDNLSPILQAMRAIHATHEVAKRNGNDSLNGSSPTDDEANSPGDPDNDQG